MKLSDQHIKSILAQTETTYKESEEITDNVMKAIISMKEPTFIRSKRIAKIGTRITLGVAALFVSSLIVSMMLAIESDMVLNHAISTFIVIVFLSVLFALKEFSLFSPGTDHRR